MFSFIYKHWGRRNQFDVEVGTTVSRSARHQSLIRDAPEITGSHTLSGEILTINPAAANSLKYAVEQMVGRSMATFLHPSVVDEFQDYLDRVSKGGDFGVSHYVTKDGDSKLWRYANSIYRESRNRCGYG